MADVYPPTYEGFTIVELLDHRKLAGMVREVTIAGAGFVHIEAITPTGTYSLYYAPGSIYGLTPCTAELALQFGRCNAFEPIASWELEPCAASLLASPEPFDELASGHVSANAAHFGERHYIGFDPSLF